MDVPARSCPSCCWPQPAWLLPVPLWMPASLQHHLWMGQVDIESITTRQLEGSVTTPQKYRLDSIKHCPQLYEPSNKNVCTYDAVLIRISYSKGKFSVTLKYSSFSKPKQIILGDDISFSLPLLPMCKLPHAMMKWLILTLSDATVQYSVLLHTRVRENLINTAALVQMNTLQYAFLPCSHLNFESVVTPQIQDSFHSTPGLTTQVTQYFTLITIDKLVWCIVCDNTYCGGKCWQM